MCEVSAGLSVAHGLCGAWTRARARPLPALHVAGWQGGEEKPHLPLPLRWADSVLQDGLKHSRNIQSQSHDGSCSLPSQSLLALSPCHGAGLVTDFTLAGDVRMSELQELGLRLGELGWLVPSQGCWSSGLSHEAAFSNCPPIYYLQHAKSQGYYTSLVFLGSNSTRLRAGTSSLPSCAAGSWLIAFSN